jgi:DNA-binding FrmR family transcriptional regulator
VLTQVAAIRAALEGFGSLVVMHQMETVLAASGVSVRDPEVMDRIDQMRSALERLIR